MNGFEYCIPTKIVFGEGTISSVGENVKKYGQKIMLVSYEKELLKKIGVYDTIISSLLEAGMEVVEFYGVKPNPSIMHIREGIDLVRSKKADVLLAVGGGSVIDETKAIAAGSCYDGDPWDLCTGKAPVQSALPIAVILTIPATSSEMNPTAVISNDAIKRKEGFSSPFFYPKVSILDPTITYSIPLKLTAISVADAMSHILEGYLTHKDPFAPIQDGIMETLFKSLMAGMETVIENPSDFNGRAIIMWAASLSWNGFPVSGVGAYGAPMHLFGHAISALYDVAHGASLSVVMPGWMEYDSKKDSTRYVKLAKNVFGITNGSDEEIAKAGINAFRAWLTKIGAPVSFKAGNIPAHELDELVENALTTAKAWGMESWYTKETALDILKMCLK